MFGMCEIRVVKAKRKIRSLPHRDYFCFLRDSKIKTVLHLITGGVEGDPYTQIPAKPGVLGVKMCGVILGHSLEVIQPIVSAVTNIGGTFWRNLQS